MQSAQCALIKRRDIDWEKLCSFGRSYTVSAVTILRL